MKPARTLWFVITLGVIAIGGLYSYREITTAKLETVLEGPLLHSLTRLAALHHTAGGSRLLFSTLEGYHLDSRDDQTQLVVWDIGSHGFTHHIQAGSAELRTGAYWPDGERWILAGALEPALFSYDEKRNVVEKLPAKLPWSGWIHGIGVSGEYAAVSTSGLNISSSYRGIYKTSLRNNQQDFFAFSNEFVGPYSAVDTIDPSGRVWFYTAYPYHAGWLEPSGKFIVRSIPGLPGWTALSWDDWLGTRLVVRDENGRLGTIKVSGYSTLGPAGTGPVLLDPKIPVDLFHRWQPYADDRLYFDTSQHKFVLLNRRGEVRYSFVPPGLSAPSIAAIDAKPREFDVVWHSADGGEHAVLGVAGKYLVSWRIGSKLYRLSNSDGEVVHEVQIPVQNLSPAAISSIATVGTHEVLLTGFLTHGEVVNWSAIDGKRRMLEKPLANLEGQIDWLVEGAGGRIYGGAYPNAVLFVMDRLHGGKGNILWRNNKSEDGRHYQRVVALSASRTQPVMAAVIRSDYSEHEETALFIDRNDGQSVPIRTAGELGIKELLTVHVDDDGRVWMLAENRQKRLVLISDEKFAMLDIGPRIEKKEQILGRVGAGFYVFDGKSIKRISSTGAQAISEKPEEGAAFVLNDRKYVYFLSAHGIQCSVSGMGNRAVGIAARINLDELRYSQIAIAKGHLLIGYQDRLFRASLPECLN